MSKLTLDSLKEKVNKENNYLSLDKYILRTPYLTFNDVKDLNVDKVRELCSNPSISEAIYLASPALHTICSKKHFIIKNIIAVLY